MPIEPITTDEKLQVSKRKERDMDDQMLFGCSGFVLTSFSCYLLGVWPFFVWFDIHLLPSLGVAFALGLPFSYVVGALSSWKFGLAGSAGFVGGSVAFSIFLYLRIEQVFLEAEARRIPFPTYPQWIQWAFPSLAVALAIALSAIILSFARDEPQTQNTP